MQNDKPKTVRMEEQSKIDWLYASGKIDRDEWSRRFDELSSTRWTASGPVSTPHPEQPPYKK
jgi:hypothetical protein